MQQSLRPNYLLIYLLEVIRRVQEILSTPLDKSCSFTSPGIVEKILKHLPTRKTPGEDTISKATLKNLPKKAILLLTWILNECIRLGYFPKAWKQSVVITIPKPFKDHSQPTSYRPISLLSFMSNVFERIILHKLITVTKYKIREKQFAFHTEHSTVLQLLKLTDQLSLN